MAEQEANKNVLSAGVEQLSKAFGKHNAFVILVVNFSGSS
jgi:hypothetical protein